MPFPFEREVPISGLVAFFRFHLTNEFEDEGLYARAMDIRRELDPQIRSLAREYLGNEFEVAQIDYERGSLTILIAVTTAGTILGGFSKYKSICDSFDKFVGQMKSLFGNRFGGFKTAPSGSSGTTVTGTWTPSGTLASMPVSLSSSSGIDLSRVLLAYFILSHAALIGLLGWLIVTHLR